MSLRPPAKAMYSSAPIYLSSEATKFGGGVLRVRLPAFDEWRDYDEGV
jgi:hypothetical protein